MLQKHYAVYGRSFFSRYDYEEVSSDDANKMVAELNDAIKNQSLINSTYDSSTGEFAVSEAFVFDYTDPIDGSVSKNQGIFVKFDDGSRIVVRLSGTGSSGATIRLYIEKHETDESKYGLDAQEYLKDNVKMAVELLKLQEFIGRVEPDVKT